ncbi:MAG: sulfotransferase [Cyanobacteria bacterium P01_A01_bin.40]
MGNGQESILTDLDRLEVGYRIKFYSTAKEDWQPYFHKLSLDSHQHNQLFLDRNQLISNHRPSIILSGLALGKNYQIKEINLVGNNCCFSGKIGCPSPTLGTRKPDLKNSNNARWQCAFNLDQKEPKQCFDLIITLNNDHQITYKKIELSLVELQDISAEIEYPINQKLATKINSIDLSRQLMASKRLQGKNYLFAIGNARSGTTALGQLLNSSPEICLGIERYSNHDNISAASFESESFFDSESENYLIRPHFYEKIKDKFEQARYIGDKRPKFTQSWQNTWLNLPQAKIIYIFRNIYDVASSYNTRATNAALGIDQSWSSSRDFSKAVRDWNQGLREFPRLAQCYEIYCVKYEDFFIDKSKMEHLFAYFQINTNNQSIIAGIDKTHRTALKLQNKPRNLSEAELKYIDSHANFEAYNQVLAFYEKQFSQISSTL